MGICERSMQGNLLLKPPLCSQKHGPLIRNKQIKLSTGVETDFDFCQTAIKEIFNDVALNNNLLANHGVRLSAANSINWGRLVPQVVHHASAYLDLAQRGVISIGEECDICIPTGNFGNILAAIYAKVR